MNFKVMTVVSYLELDIAQLKSLKADYPIYLFIFFKLSNSNPPDSRIAVNI